MKFKAVLYKTILFILIVPMVNWAERFHNNYSAYGEQIIDDVVTANPNMQDTSAALQRIQQKFTLNEATAEQVSTAFRGDSWSFVQINIIDLKKRSLMFRYDEVACIMFCTSLKLNFDFDQEEKLTSITVRVSDLFL